MKTHNLVLIFILFVLMFLFWSGLFLFSKHLILLNHSESLVLASSFLFGLSMTILISIIEHAMKAVKRDF